MMSACLILRPDPTNSRHPPPGLALYVFPIEVHPRIMCREKEQNIKLYLEHGPK